MWDTYCMYLVFCDILKLGTYSICNFWELKLVGSSWWHYVWNRICWCYESQVCLSGGM